jgi:hypothetical protein
MKRAAARRGAGGRRGDTIAERRLRSMRLSAGGNRLIALIGAC